MQDDSSCSGLRPRPICSPIRAKVRAYWPCPSPLPCPELRRTSSSYWPELTIVPLFFLSFASSSPHFVDALTLTRRTSTPLTSLECEPRRCVSIAALTCMRPCFPSTPTNPRSPLVVLPEHREAMATLAWPSRCREWPAHHRAVPPCRHCRHRACPGAPLTQPPPPIDAARRGVPNGEDATAGDLTDDEQTPVKPLPYLYVYIVWGPLTSGSLMPAA